MALVLPLVLLEFTAPRAAALLPVSAPLAVGRALAEGKALCKVEGEGRELMVASRAVPLLLLLLLLLARGGLEARGEAEGVRGGREREVEGLAP